MIRARRYHKRIGTALNGPYAGQPIPLPATGSTLIFTAGRKTGQYIGNTWRNA
jgi:hypothetical protein